MDNQQSSLLELASSFLRLGFTALGGPAAHIAMLHDEVVTRRGWLTEQHFLDLIGATNLIPGPNSTEMVTHVATIGIFATSFVFVALLNPYVPRLREVPWTAVLLDGVNVASLGLMAGVTVILGRAALVDPLTIVIALVTAVLLFRFRVNTTWLVLAAAALGLALAWQGVLLPLPYPMWR